MIGVCSQKEVVMVLIIREQEEQVRSKAGAEAHWGADKMAQRVKVRASQAYQLNFSQRWVGETS